MLNRTRATMRGFRRENRAAAMVEFAIVAPLLFILVFGIIDFGRAFFLLNNLTNATRDGARLGATLPYEAGSDAQIEVWVRARINDVNKDSGSVVVYRETVSGQKAVRVRMESYPFRPASFLVIKAVKRFNVQSQFRHEFQT